MPLPKRPKKVTVKKEPLPPPPVPLFNLLFGEDDEPMDAIEPPPFPKARSKAKVKLPKEPGSGVTGDLF